MRPLVLSALSLAALAAALPAHAQIREHASCDRDRALIAQLEARDREEIVAEGTKLSEYRDRYAFLNHQIAELNVSGKNPSRLRLLREQRTVVLGQINAMRARANQPFTPASGIATAKARMEANRCRNTSRRPADRPSTTVRPWNRPAPPIAGTQPSNRPAPPAASTRPSNRPATTYFPPWESLPPSARAPVPLPAQPAASPYSAWMTGTFSSSFGTMRLSPGGGSYDQNGGTLAVTKISGATMEGTWRQTGSGGQCPDGSNRGRFSFTFTATGFTGSWSYCDAPPDKGGWNGTRQ